MLSLSKQGFNSEGCWPPFRQAQGDTELPQDSQHKRQRWILENVSKFYFGGGFRGGFVWAGSQTPGREGYKWQQRARVA